MVYRKFKIENVMEPQLIEKKLVKNSYDFLKKQLPWSKNSFTHTHHRVLPNATLAPWLNDDEFLKTYEKIKDYTLVDIYRCYELWVLAKQITNIEGAILEVGVWRGGTGLLMAEANRYTNKKIYLADTFNGVVKAGTKDTTYKGGEHDDTSVELVSNLISNLSLNNIDLLEGIFPEETSHRVTEKIAMLHCDVDVYNSSKDVVQWCLSRMSIGSLIVFDDYGFFGCEGITTYCNELKLRKDLIFIHNLNGHAIFVKIF